jgi:hypothetical protein
MAEIVSSLFGIDPAALQAQQEKQDLDVAYRFAQLDPMQQAQFAIYRGGAGLGRNVSGFLGGDEQMQRATQIRQLASQFDITSEDGLRQFAQAAANISPEVAQAAIKRADEIKTTRVKQAESIATTQAKLREKTLPTSNLGKLVTERDALIASGLPANDPRVIAYDNAIKAEGQGKGTTVKVDMTGPKNVLDIDKKDAESILKNRDSLEKSIPLLESSIAQLDKGIIGGTFSDARTALATGLASAGIKDPKITQYLANTKTFNANRIELATAIAKQLGVNPTDRDFQASLDRFASASENPASSKIFLTEMTALKKQQLADANNALNYFRQNEGSFAGYDRPLPRAFSGTGSELSGMTTEQLKQQIQKLKNPTPKQ